MFMLVKNLKTIYNYDLCNEIKVFYLILNMISNKLFIYYLF